MHARRMSSVVVALLVIALPFFSAACATRSHTSVRTYERTDAAVVEEPTDDDGKVVSEESGDWKMVSPGTMVVDP